MDLLSKTQNRKLFVCFGILFFLIFGSLHPIFASESKREETSGAIRDLGRKRKILVNKLKTGITRDEGDSGFVGLGVELDSGLGIFDAFFASFSMILVTLMAMRHPKSIVLSGALSALFVMTVLFIGLGRIVPNLILRKHTNSATTVLYAFFGLRLLYVAWRSDSKASQKKEMEEVEEKLEAGQGKAAVRQFFSRFCTPIFLELAAHKNAVGVATAATIGHTICTSLAVVGGSMLASKISQRTVAIVGGLVFHCLHIFILRYNHNFVD